MGSVCRVLIICTDGACKKSKRKFNYRGVFSIISRRRRTFSLRSSLFSLLSKKAARSRTCDKAGSPWAVLGETAWQIDSAVPFFCFLLFCLCFCAFLRNLLSLRYFCSRRHGFQGVGAFMFYVVFVTRLPGCSISGVSRVNSCSVSAGFQVFLKQSFHFLRVRGIDDADTGIVDVDVLMPHAVDLPRFMYHDP